MVVSAKIVFWASLLVVIYANFGYAVVAWCIAKLRPKPIKMGDRHPAVTCIIPVFNEEEIIAEKIRNSLALAYPLESLQVIVVSDGSTDRTNDILRTFNDPRVTCLLLEQNRGKGVAILTALEQATGEIVVLTDADSMPIPGALHSLMQYFADESIGMVLGQVVVRSEVASSVSSGVSSYWRFEDLLRKLESRSGSTISPSGVLLALRRSLLKELPSNCCDDFYLLLSVLSQGYRVVSEPEATAVTILPREARGEFRRKTRIQARALATFWQFRMILLNPRFGLTFRFFSHKICRWLVPWALIVLLISNAMLLHEDLYRVLFVGQVGLYVVASLAGICHVLGRRIPGPHLVFYFMLANAALAVGSMKWLLVGSPSTWKR